MRALNTSSVHDRSESPRASFLTIAMRHLILKCICSTFMVQWRYMLVVALAHNSGFDSQNDALNQSHFMSFISITAARPINHSIAAESTDAPLFASPEYCFFFVASMSVEADLPWDYNKIVASMLSKAKRFPTERIFSFIFIGQRCISFPSRFHTDTHAHMREATTFVRMWFSLGPFLHRHTAFDVRCIFNCRMTRLMQTFYKIKALDAHTHTHT